MDFLFYFYIIIIIFFEVFAQYIFKLSYLKSNSSYFNSSYILSNIIKPYIYLLSNNLIVFIGVIFYAIAGFFAYKIIKYGHLGIVNVIWHLIHFIILFLIGYYLFNEKFTFKKILASLFGLISLSLFMIEGIN